MADPFDTSRSLDRVPPPDVTSPGAAGRSGARIEQGTGPGPMPSAPQPGANSALDGLLRSAGAANVPIGHAFPPQGPPLPAVRFTTSPTVGECPVTAQPAASLTSALSPAEHQRVAALLAVPSTEWRGTREQVNNGGRRLQVSYAIRHPEAGTSPSARPVVLALEIDLSADPRQADALTRMVVGSFGTPGLALPVRERRVFGEGETSVAVLVPNKAYTPAQEAALAAAMPASVTFASAGDGGTVNYTFTEGDDGTARVAKWVLNRDPVLGAWVLCDLEVDASLPGPGDVAGTLPLNPATTGTAASASGSKPSWKLDDTFDTTGTALFRSGLSKRGIRGTELPKTGNRTDGKKMAEDLLLACRERTPQWQTHDSTSYNGVALPNWPGLAPEHRGARLGVQLYHQGDAVTNMRLFDFDFSQAGGSAASLAAHATDTTAVATGSTTACAASPAVASTPAVSSTPLTATTPAIAPTPASASGSAPAADLMGTFQVATQAPASDLTMGLDPGFKSNPSSAYRRFLRDTLRLGTAALPSVPRGSFSDVNWKKVALDLVQTFALPAATPPGDYFSVRTLPDHWDLPAHMRGQAYRYTLKVEGGQVVDVRLSMPDGRMT